MDKYGLIGYPLVHSFSKSFFNEKFQNEDIDAEYINFEIKTIDDLPEVLATNPELKGLNVTIPYKEKVLSFLDYVSVEARAIGAVNVIRVESKGDDTFLRGYNSEHRAAVGKPPQKSHHTRHRRSVESRKLRTEVIGAGNAARKPFRTPGNNTI